MAKKSVFSKRFSMKKKLVIIFGLLIMAAGFVEGIFAIHTARKAVTEKVETHLIDKAKDTAEIVDGRISTFLQLLEGIAKEPILKDPTVSYHEKVDYLQSETDSNEKIEQLNLYGLSGVRTDGDGTVVDVHDRDWFKAASAGNKFISEPILSRSLNKVVIIFALPLYDNNKNKLGVLNCVVDAKHLSNIISDIVVGKTGFCYILGLTGTTIATKDFEIVERMENVEHEAKSNPKFTSLAAFTKVAVKNNKPSVEFYEYNGIRKISSYAKMKTTGWTVIINAPVNEFMGTVNTLRTSLIGIGIIIFLAAQLIAFFIARTIVSPIRIAVSALQNISQGEGDLTACLPIRGNDEITDLSEYFNKLFQR